MPIRPEEKDHYPADWSLSWTAWRKAEAKLILDRCAKAAVALMTEPTKEAHDA